MGIALIASLVLLFALISVMSGPSCGFVTSSPEKASNKLDHSSDNQALVDVSAYLQYADENLPFKNGTDGGRKNMLLKFESFKFENFDQDKNKQQLKLLSDCADIFLNIEKVNTGFQVTTIDVALKIPNYDAYSCKVYTVYPYIEQKTGSHYREEGRYYACRNSVKGRDGKTEMRDIVYLAFNKLEFEIYGDPEKTAQNVFSTPIKSSIKKFQAGH